MAKTDDADGGGAVAGADTTGAGHMACTFSLKTLCYAVYACAVVLLVGGPVAALGALPPPALGGPVITMDLRPIHAANACVLLCVLVLFYTIRDRLDLPRQRSECKPLEFFLRPYVWWDARWLVFYCVAFLVSITGALDLDGGPAALTALAGPGAVSMAWKVLKEQQQRSEEMPHYSFMGGPVMNPGGGDMGL